MSKMKPFRTSHTFDTPDEAIEFFQHETGEEIPEGVAAFLEVVANYDEDAVFNVQPGIATNYIAVARPQDRNPWAFAKTDKIVVRVGHRSNALALMELFDEVMPPEALTKGTLADVEFEPRHGDSDAAEFCLVFAAAHAAPRENLTL